ncbi:MAG: hypothetical protein QW575_06305 [Thermoproteota archaeon]
MTKIRIRLLRKDGVIQNYYISKKNLDKYHYIPLVRAYSSTPPHEVRYMYRATVAINYVIHRISGKKYKQIPLHHEYFSMKITKWFRNYPDEEKIETLKEKLIKALEKKLGYKQEDWWFDAIIGESVNEEIYNERYIDKEELKEEY